MPGCEQAPDFSPVPHITYESITKVRDANGDDSLTISLFYQDGDGDLGLGPDDITSPYQPENSDGSPNFFHFNYHITIYEKQGGDFVLFTPNNPGLFDSTAFDGRFPRLAENNEGRYVEGTLHFGFKTFSNTSGQFDPNDTLMFRVKIVDRALNISNTIETDEVVVNTP